MHQRLLVFSNLLIGIVYWFLYDVLLSDISVGSAIYKFVPLFLLLTITFLVQRNSRWGWTGTYVAATTLIGFTAWVYKDTLVALSKLGNDYSFSMFIDTPLLYLTVLGVVALIQLPILENKRCRSTYSISTSLRKVTWGTSAAVVATIFILL